MSAWWWLAAWPPASILTAAAYSAHRTRQKRAAAHPAQPEIDRLHALLALPAYRADRPAPVRKDRR